MKRLVLLLMVVGSLFGAGCQKAAPAKHYAIQAEVISIHPERRTIMLKHGDIPGLMPAMTMDYMVADPTQIEKLQPGDTISADLVISDSIGRLEKITLVEKANANSPAPAPAKIP
jgi:Cu/Ag efflux protein CusF